MPEKVSIVIPVYNCEKYLRRCVDSILNQTYSAIEIILVDDGSKDSSAELIREYLNAKSDVVRGVFQANQGPAAARNAGIREATGKYLMFIDSDDYIDVDYVEQYVTIMDNNDLDVVMGGYKKITGTHVDHVRQLLNTEFSKYIVVGPYAKLFRTAFLEEYGLAFPQNLADEDLYFNMEVLRRTTKIGYTDNTGYYYYTNPSSITSELYRGFSDRIDFPARLDLLNAMEMDNRELHNYFIIRHIIWYLLNAGKGSMREKFLKEYRRYFGWLACNIPNYKTNKYISFLGPEGEQKQVGLIVFAFIVLHRLGLIGLFARLYCKKS